MPFDIARLFGTTVTATFPADEIDEAAESPALLAREAAVVVMEAMDDAPVMLYETPQGFAVTGERSAILIGADGSVTQTDPDELDDEIDEVARDEAARDPALKNLLYHVAKVKTLRQDNMNGVRVLVTNAMADPQARLKRAGWFNSEGNVWGHEDSEYTVVTRGGKFIVIDTDPSDIGEALEALGEASDRTDAKAVEKEAKTYAKQRRMPMHLVKPMPGKAPGLRIIDDKTWKAHRGKPGYTDDLHVKVVEALDEAAGDPAFTMQFMQITPDERKEVGGPRAKKYAKLIRAGASVRSHGMNSDDPYTITFDAPTSAKFNAALKWAIAMADAEPKKYRVTKIEGQTTKTLADAKRLAKELAGLGESVRLDVEGIAEFVATTAAARRHRLPADLAEKFELARRLEDEDALLEVAADIAAGGEFSAEFDAYVGAHGYVTEGCGKGHDDDLEKPKHPGRASKGKKGVGSPIGGGSAVGRTAEGLDEDVGDLSLYFNPMDILKRAPGFKGKRNQFIDFDVLDEMTGMLDDILSGPLGKKFRKDVYAALKKRILRNKRTNDHVAARGFSVTESLDEASSKQLHPATADSVVITHSQTGAVDPEMVMVTVMLEKPGRGGVPQVKALAKKMGGADIEVIKNSGDVEIDAVFKSWAKAEAYAKAAAKLAKTLDPDNGMVTLTENTNTSEEDDMPAHLTEGTTGRKAATLARDAVNALNKAAAMLRPLGSKDNNADEAAANLSFFAQEITSTLNQYVSKVTEGDDMTPEQKQSIREALALLDDDHEARGLLEGLLVELDLDTVDKSVWTGVASLEKAVAKEMDAEVRLPRTGKYGKWFEELFSTAGTNFAKHIAGQKVKDDPAKLWDHTARGMGNILNHLPDDAFDVETMINSQNALFKVTKKVPKPSEFSAAARKDPKRALAEIVAKLLAFTPSGGFYAEDGEDFAESEDAGLDDVESFIADCLYDELEENEDLDFEELSDDEIGSIVEKRSTPAERMKRRKDDARRARGQFKVSKAQRRAMSKSAKRFAKSSAGKAAMKKGAKRRAMMASVEFAKPDLSRFLDEARKLGLPADLDVDVTGSRVRVTGLDEAQAESLKAAMGV